MVKITGPHASCVAAKRKIEEFVDLSMKPKPARRSEVCTWDVDVVIVLLLSHSLSMSIKFLPSACEWHPVAIIVYYK